MQHGLAIPGSDALLLSCATPSLPLHQGFDKSSTEPAIPSFMLALSHAFNSDEAVAPPGFTTLHHSFMLALSHAFNSDEAVTPHGLARQKSEASGPGMARPIHREVRFLRDRTRQPGRPHLTHSH